MVFFSRLPAVFLAKRPESGLFFQYVFLSTAKAKLGIDGV
jgi:hypothetical protein